jgi:hypothetical protein
MMTPTLGCAATAAAIAGTLAIESFEGMKTSLMLSICAGWIPFCQYRFERCTGRARLYE